MGGVSQKRDYRRGGSRISQGRGLISVSWDFNDKATLLLRLV